RSPFVVSNTTPAPDLYTLSLHDALPISPDAGFQTLKSPGWNRILGTLTTAGNRCHTDSASRDACLEQFFERDGQLPHANPGRVVDRKSTRLNSSHQIISYAVFCLKKKKK